MATDGVFMNMRYCAFLIVFCGALSGQQPGPRTRELVLTKSGERDAASFHLRNAYSAAATAWILQCETPEGGSKHYWNDQDLSFQTKPIGAGEEIDFKIPAPPPIMAQRAASIGSCDDYRVAAAVFADGSVSGDLQWIDAIVAERRQTYKEIGKAADILNTAISKGTDTKDVIDQLTEWQKADAPGPGAMAARPVATRGPSWGWQSRAAGPPPNRIFRSPVAGAALWLLETEQESLGDAVKSLADWRGRLAKLAPVTETGGPAPGRARILSGGPVTPQPDSELMGKPAPDFALKDIDGREYTLASLRGKPVLLDFWATWCEPCRESMPHVQKLYVQFKDKGLVVLGVDTNEAAEQARKYFEENKYSFGNLLGSGNDIVQKYGASGIPRMVLIDKDGVVRYAHRGWGSGMDLTPEVEKILN